jgi:RNA polymerase sigma-70 factor (ECF subfamily)
MKPLFSSALLRTQSDERLATLIAAGHERAFETIVQRYGGPIERYCARSLSRSDAEDAVQQVLLKAWAALSSGTEVRSLKPWLFRIAQTTIIDTAEKSGFDHDELERSLRPHEGPDSEFEQRALIRKTLIGLAALPEAQREALLRGAVDGESRAEIAQALGVSEGAVRQLLYRARVRLRTVATAVTPLPLVTWIMRPAEVAATGGVAQASAIVAGAGVLALGPVAAHELAHRNPAKAPARIERPVPLQPGATSAAFGRRAATPSHRATVTPGASRAGKDGEGGGGSRRGSPRRDDASSRTEEAPADPREQESATSDKARDDAGQHETRAPKEKPAPSHQRDRETGATKRARQARGHEPRASKPAESDGQDGEKGRKDHVKAASAPSTSRVGVGQDDSGSRDGGASVTPSDPRN